MKMFKSTMLLLLIFLSTVAVSADLVLQGGGPTIIEPGNYGAITVKAGAQGIMRDGQYNIQNFNTNEKGWSLLIESTATGQIGNLNSAGGMQFTNQSVDFKVKNVELQGPDNIFYVKASLDVQVIQLSDPTSKIIIEGCGTILTTNGHASLNAQSNYHSIELRYGGQWLANGGMSIDNTNIFFGKGFIKVNGSFNLNKHLTDSNDIQICYNGHIQDWQRTQYLDNVKIDCQYLCETMPVTLIAFGAKINEDKVYLIWSSSEETRSDRYVIQRSYNGKQWVSLDSLKSVGESKVVNKYDYFDLYPLKGINYYRLKMIDTDGTFAYSKIKEITITSTQDHLYPVPTNDRLFIQNMSDVSNIVITSLTGKIVYSSKTLTSDGINLTNLNNGLYIAKLYYSSGEITTQKVQVQR